MQINEKRDLPFDRVVGRWGFRTLGHDLVYALVLTRRRKLTAHKLQRSFSRKKQNSFPILTPPPALPSHLLGERLLGMTHWWDRMKTDPTISARYRAGLATGFVPRGWKPSLPNFRFDWSPWDEAEEDRSLHRCILLFLPHGTGFTTWGTLFSAEHQMSYSLPPPKFLTVP